MFIKNMSPQALEKLGMLIMQAVSSKKEINTYFLPTRLEVDVINLVTFAICRARH